MKKRLLSLLLLVSLSLSVFAGCNFSSLLGGGKTSEPDSQTSSTSEAPAGPVFDPYSKEDPELNIVYSKQLTLDETSAETKKMEVTVKSYIDGDTTHFYIPQELRSQFKNQDALKARYLGVNTPESTGKLEEWGKKAANFTKNRLLSASSIILETDGNTWEVDSTGERYLVWVWYKPQGSDTYVNLNLELLQYGLAVGSKAGSTRYGETCTAAINQAIQLELHVHSKLQDPDFFYGTAYEVDLKELRTNPEEYVGSKVAFEGYVSYYSNQGVYVEKYDDETQRYYGMYVYYGYFLTTQGKKVLAMGNHVRIVGSLQYYETGDSYQVSDLTYDPFDLNNPENIKLLDDQKHPAANVETTIDTFNSEVTIRLDNADGEPTDVTMDYAALALNTSICMKNLKVTKAYTTNNGGDNDGAISLTCTVDGKTITVRTAVLVNEDSSIVSQDVYVGKTIDVYGIIDTYNGEYQIKVFKKADITIH